MSTPRRPNRKQHKRQTLAAVLGLSLVLVASSWLLARWQARWYAAWQSYAETPAPDVSAETPRGSALWIMHPAGAAAAAATEMSLLPIDATVQVAGEWTPVDDAETLSLLLSGLTPSDEAAAAYAPQLATLLPEHPADLLSIAAETGRPTVLAAPPAAVASGYWGNAIEQVTLGDPQALETLHARLGADEAQLLVVYLDRALWKAPAQAETAALAAEARTHGWLVIESAVPAEGVNVTITHWVNAGRVADAYPAEPQDVVPTLAWWLGLATPPQATGRALVELHSDADTARAEAELSAAHLARERAVAGLEPIAGVLPPQIDGDLTAAEAALDAGNWRGAQQLARLARNAAQQALETQRQTAWAREQLNRGLLAGVAALLSLYLAVLMSGRRGWPTLHAGSMGAGVLVVWWLLAPSQIGSIAAADSVTRLPAWGAALTVSLVAWIGSAIIERRTMLDTWRDLVCANLWLCWLLALPAGTLFGLQGGWLTWRLPDAAQAVALARLLSVWKQAAIAGVLAATGLMAIVATAQLLWHAVRQGVDSHLEASRARRDHR